MDSAPCRCSLSGILKGDVSNPKDEFYKGYALVKASVCTTCIDVKNSKFNYTVISGNKQDTLELIGLPKTFDIICPKFSKNNKPLGETILMGRGRVEKTASTIPVSDRGTFIFIFDDNKFRIIIQGDEDSEFYHDSGIVEAAALDDFRIDKCY